MGRFGLQVKGAYRDVEDNFDDGSDDADEDNVESEEEEPPHPLPFVTSPRWGLTRFGLYPPKETYSVLNCRHYGHPVVLLDEELEVLKSRAQKFPFIERYWDRSTASASAMMEYSHKDPPFEARDDSFNEITRLLSASTLIDATPAKHAQIQNEVGLKLRKLNESALKEYQKLELWKESYERKRDRQHKESCNALRSILKADHEDAKAIIQLEKHEQMLAENRAKQAEDEVRRQQDAQDEARRREQEAKDKLVREKAEKKEKQSNVDKELQRKELERWAYITEAHALVEKLVDIRAAVQPYETNSAVSKRRMNMKKICRGRVNTLAADVGKIQSVAVDVIAAIKAEKELDDQMQTQLQQGNPEVSLDTTKGQLYAMDLLASSAVVRIQAEGFNGPRGDGFPLAAFLAMVSSEIEGFAPIFEAHIYSVCPTAIPALPKPDKDATEDDLMESLGMTKNKNGEFESFERFLHRTEGIVSMVANIMSSHPDNHTLFGGHKSAISWLRRFMEMLPPKPEQMPLNTAPVLDAFLTGAGHMMANLYASEFKALLDLIMTDTITRLDEGPVGAPRAHRLKETIKGGFAGFRTHLPSRALDALYNDGGSVPPPALVPPSTNPTFGSMSTPSNPFGAPVKSNASPFAASQFVQSSGGIGGPIGGQNNSSSDSYTRGDNMASNDAGMTDSSAGAFNGTPFGGQSSTSPFGNAAATASPFGVSQPVNPTFGTAPGIATPFGAPHAAQAPFGSASSTLSQFGPSQATQTPFGSPSLTSTPFGAPHAAQTPFGAPLSTSSSFGGSFGSTASSTLTPFGAPQSGTSTFGVGNVAASTPFGGTQTGPSPFGGAGTAMSAPFGAPQAVASPFGGTLSQFGAPQQANTLFGSSQPAPTPFGSQSTTLTPFGAPSINPSPFGGASQANQAPFGAGAASIAPFSGGAQQTTPFGGPFGGSNHAPSPSPFGGQPQGAPFGGNFAAPGGTKQAPCKFFAQGSCRYGENCRFSHDSPSNGLPNATGFGAGNSFGGPRR